MTLNAKDLAKKDSTAESRVQYTNERLKRANGSDKDAVIGIVILISKRRIRAAVTLVVERQWILSKLDRMRAMGVSSARTNNQKYTYHSTKGTPTERKGVREG
jgi:hypothetical protein